MRVEWGEYWGFGVVGDGTVGGWELVTLVGEGRK